MRKIEDAVDLTAVLDRVRCPTLLLHAARDPEVPVAEAEWLVSRLFDARLVPLDSDHHLPQASEAAWPRWLREVRGFLPREPDASSPLATLTARETEVVDLLTQGRDNTAIAEALGLGMKTVRNHVSNVYRKLGTGTRERTAVLAHDAGLGRTFRPGPSG
jgi:DNA-binding CsgD family transcriptional regulator